MTDFNLILIYISIAFVILASIIAIASLIRFSSILVRLVALEVLTNLLMGGIALWSLINRQPIFIDICLTLALIMFLGVIAYYQFIMSQGKS